MWPSLLAAALTLTPAERAARDALAWQGLAAKLRPTGVAAGDLDGDGVDEIVATFAPRAFDPDDEDEPGGGDRGAVLVLTPKAGKLALAWCGLFEGSAASDPSVKEGAVRFTSSRGLGAEPVHAELAWGRDFYFTSDPRSPFHGAQATATSERAGDEAFRALDGDLATAWVEGAPGAGVEEELSVAFPQPVALGMLGVVGGDARGARAWRDANRLRHARVAWELAAGGGGSAEASFPDARRVKWQEVAARGVAKVSLSIEGVYTGEASDDATPVAELLFCELVPDPAASPAAEAPRPGVPRAPDDPAKAAAAEGATLDRLLAPTLAPDHDAVGPAPATPPAPAPHPPAAQTP